MTINALKLSQIEWHPLASDSAILNATHAGILRTDADEIRFYRMESGQTAVHPDDFLKLLMLGPTR